MITSTARSGRLAALSVSFVLAAASSFAQTARGQSPRSGSWEIGGGIVYIQGFDMGDQSADLTRPTGDPLELFSTSSELKAVIGLQGRLGFYLSPQLSVEGGVRYAKPKLSIRITGDFENAPNETAEETLNQYLIDGSVLWHFGRLSATSGGVVPFIMGGVGYIRELHDGQELVETGVEYHAGAGVKVWFGGGGARLGLRAEGGISIRDGGFDFEDKTRYMPVAAGSVIYLF